MGSRSDWNTMRVAAETLDELGVRYETRVVSAHRTPDLLFEYASSAADRGLKVIIAGAGGAAHLPGHGRRQDRAAGARRAGRIEGAEGHGLAAVDRADAGRGSVGTLAIGKAGAVNAALLAAAIVALEDDGVRDRLKRFRATQTQNVLSHPDPDDR